MKKFIPFILVSTLLFITMKGINHFNGEDTLPKDTSGVSADSLQGFSLQREIIFCVDSQTKLTKRKNLACLSRLQPSDFKASCFHNCKLLSSSKNGLCFFPAGLSSPEISKPLYDEVWKRQFLQYM